MARGQAEGRELPGAQAGARLIAHISGGRPGYAVRLLEDPAALATRAEMLADLQSVLAASRAQRFAYAEKYRDDRESLRGLFLIWLSFWRDVLLRAGGAQTPPANIDQAEQIEALGSRLPLREVRRIVSGLELAVDRLDANVNARLLAEVLLLDLPRAS
jgi:DNA polymerase-3 subunit delta'